MRTLKLTIAYEGTRYAGWQVQAAGTGGAPQRTIQGTLERAIRQIVRERVAVVGSGRTDAGVHALAQVAHVKTASMLPCGRLVRAINHLLPPDITVTAVEDVPAGFHARFSAVTKRYRYRVVNGPTMPPFIRRYAHQVRAPLNIALMRREAAAVKGTHDFSSLARRGGAGRSTTRRTVTAIAVRRREGELHIDIEADGFLHTMVRSIAGTLIDIGRGRLPAGTMRRLLSEPRARRLAGATAPPQGLMLLSVAHAPLKRLTA